MQIEAARFVDGNPCPRVELVLSDLPDGATVAVTRSFGRESATVRGAAKLTESTPVVTDYECPLGPEITYTATAIQGGVQVDSASATVVVPPMSNWHDEAWIQDPLAPTTARLVRLPMGALNAYGFTSDGVVSQVIGQRLPVAYSSGPVASSGHPMMWYAESQDVLDTAAEDWQGRVVLVRSIEPIQLPRLAYMLFGEVLVENNIIDDYEDRRFFTLSCAAQTVQPPSANVVVPAYTWDQWQTDHQGLTWDDFEALWAGKTWTDFVRNPERPNG